MPRTETNERRRKPARNSPEKTPSHSEPVRVLLLADDETPTAALIETRLRNVRQLYALDFILRVPELAGTELIPVAALLLSTDENAELDSIIPIPLQIRAAGTGTFWVDLFLQIPAHLPTPADLQRWAEWLKNAHGALVEIAAVCGMVRAWLKKRAAKKTEAAAKRPEDPAGPIGQIMKRIDELKGATEDQKEEIRRAIIRNLQTFEPMALQRRMKIPKNFPVKLRKK
jgi:hypothetical protein